MNSLTLNAIALLVASLSFSVLLGPYLQIPPVVPATITLGVLGLVTTDTLGFQSRGTTLCLDWFAQQSAAHRQRVIHHEAGHFLVAQLLDIPVTDYSLSAWEAFKKGHPGQGGVQVSAPASGTSTLRASDLERYCTVWMAGGVAEFLVFRTVAGGADDLATLRATLKILGLNVNTQERQAGQRAQQLLQTHWSTYEALVEAMTQRISVADCCHLIQQCRSTHPL